MIKFFRQIRFKLMETGKTSRYFKYALGEIILVVIGILIALQVSNWNQTRVEANRMTTYYEKLIEELDQKTIKVKNELKRNIVLTELQRRTIEIIASKNTKDIPELKQKIGSIATAWTTTYSFVTLNEFISQGLITKVRSASLKDGLQKLQTRLVNFISGDNYIDNQYNTLIEPYFAKHINYAKTALPHYREGLIQGGPETDFETLFNSLELWNVATFKLETTNSRINNLEELLELITDLKLALKEELSRN